ncbi:LytR/AlgR family response regulator transcription factor [Cytobacillus solani]|uniref:LytTR family transcriptional regulator n=1 Tax=Cytobacillus solani TaxID=1637975 RepID=A0A0Q3QTU9_9BACI|nr:LytTR family DNA-binding domain-containing protein [Cytobacillus solani]KOP79972.1 LytTR family transcriptional regulator [Bacillus sp. FJAT-21945]KQL21142.1 LytTR family transcriptional regulator [Cytobacillus solani]USK54443.1 LytTR family DNA-binding domain-containing protein [Cytobacillus solani]
MEKFKVIIADDDHPSRMILMHFIQLLPEYEVVQEASNGEEFIQFVMKEEPEIVLVDIHMPGLNGMEAVKICKERLPALQVIFTTGYDEFAVEAFNISAADYIVKPIERTRLFIALEKAKKLIQLNSGPNQLKKTVNKLAIKSNNTFLYLSVDDILYAEKEGRKTILHTKNSYFETSESLQELEGKLPNQFYKTHRSFLVNLKKITKIVSSGETYLAYFNCTEKIAYISKLKINDVHRSMGT